MLVKCPVVLVVGNFLIYDRPITTAHINSKYLMYFSICLCLLKHLVHKTFVLLNVILSCNKGLNNCFIGFICFIDRRICESSVLLGLIFYLWSAFIQSAHSLSFYNNKVVPVCHWISQNLLDRFNSSFAESWLMYPGKI